MGETKHTPGPWHWDQPHNWYRIAARIYHEAHDRIATVGLKGWGRKRGLANARLIAAAPTGHELLAEIHAWFTDGDTAFIIDRDDVMRDGRTAGEAVSAYLAAVEGEQ